MTGKLEARLSLFSDPAALDCLRNIRRGVEREALRVSRAGLPSRQPHPPTLGAPLTHRRITTDFSEALLEFVSPVETGVSHLLQRLEEVQAVVCRSLPDGEFLWAASMPPHLQSEADVPIADYGPSNSGRIKRLYREGLAHRYGRYMQAVAGVHYNVSMTEELWPLCTGLFAGETVQQVADHAYFCLVRNCRRLAWLPVYLFGASPAVSGDFLHGREGRFELLENGDYAPPGATSLRMGKLGYQSERQTRLRISANSLQEYIRHLCRAILDSCPDYEAIGLKHNGQLLQLNTGTLQIENEYYGVVRPKRTAPSGTALLYALAQQGVEYVELRCLDIDPYHPLGIAPETLYFLDSFMLYCLLQESPPADETLECEALENLHRTVEQGRDPQLRLQDRGTPRTLQDWGAEALQGICRIAEMLDQAVGGERRVRACALQKQKLEDVARTPAARMLADMQAARQNFFDFSLEHSQRYTAELADLELPPAVEREFVELAQRSRAEKKSREQEDREDFSMYLQKYYAAYRSLDTQ